MNPSFGCDLTTYQGILSQYGVLTSLRGTYSSLSGSQLYSSNLPTYGGSNEQQLHPGELLDPGLQPCILKHNARWVFGSGLKSFMIPCRDLGSELRNSLSCVLDGSNGSSKALDRCITLLVDGVSRRLDLTQQLIDIMARRDGVNDELNLVK